jgi:hypothetical protein
MEIIEYRGALSCGNAACFAEVRIHYCERFYSAFYSACVSTARHFSSLQLFSTAHHFRPWTRRAGPLEATGKKDSRVSTALAYLQLVVFYSSSRAGNIRAQKGRMLRLEAFLQRFRLYTCSIPPLRLGRPLPFARRTYEAAELEPL